MAKVEYELLAEFNKKGDPEDERQLHHKLESAFNKGADDTTSRTPGRFRIGR
jgi:hypothetical protein